MDERTFAQMTLDLERKLLALVDAIHDTRLWDEHQTRVERLERVIADMDEARPGSGGIPILRTEPGGNLDRGLLVGEE